MRTIQMSSYTVGEDCFEAIPAVLAPYQAKSVVLVGGRRALAAAAPGIRAALDSTDVQILDESHLQRIAELAQNTNEWKQANPAPFSPEAFIEAIKAADAFGRNLK